MPLSDFRLSRVAKNALAKAAPVTAKASAQEHCARNNFISVADFPVVIKQDKQKQQKTPVNAGVFLFSLFIS